MQVKPKKSLGQNFLKDEKIIEKIISSADLKSDNVVVEIGPGEGALTEKLVKKCGKLLALELDDRLIDKLKNKFSSDKNFEIIHEDILKANLPQIFSERKIENKSYKVIANLPYYITSAIIRLFLESKVSPEEMIVMVQKEVAQRIVASPGEMSILAVSVQYYAKAEIMFEVPRESFDPVPKVDSAVIKITSHSRLTTNDKEEVKRFFQIVKAGFSAKRKTLLNNLSNGLQKDRKEIEEILKNMNFLPTVRAQELSVEDWKKLTKVIGN